MSYSEGPNNYLRAEGVNHTIRSVVDEDGEIWLLAMDIAELFEIKTAKLVQMVHPRDRIQVDLRNKVHTEHPIRNKGGGDPLIQGRGNLSRVWVITARGMSHVIMRSMHPLAVAINDWMYIEVLPSLILHGKYFVEEGELADIRYMICKLEEEVDFLRTENRVLWEHSDMTVRDYIEGD